MPPLPAFFPLTATAVTYPVADSGTSLILLGLAFLALAAFAWRRRVVADRRAVEEGLSPKSKKAVLADGLIETKSWD